MMDELRILGPGVWRWWTTDGTLGIKGTCITKHGVGWKALQSGLEALGQNTTLEYQTSS